jgi:hypothetical protein
MGKALLIASDFFIFDCKKFNLFPFYPSLMTIGGPG